MVPRGELDTIIKAGASSEDGIVEFLQEMIRTPSVNPPGEYDDIYELVKTEHQQHDWICETIRTPDEVLKQIGLDPNFPRPNLLTYINKGSGPTIVLNAHFDTVPVEDGESWEHDPFGAEKDNGRIYGRGAVDSKGRIAAYTLACLILERTSLIPENATIILAITCDEETGGEAGPGYLIHTKAVRPDYAIVEGNCESVWIGASGVLQFEVKVSGTAAHAGVNLEDGANAIKGACRVIQTLEEYADTLLTLESDVKGIEGPTCVPATIEGGIKTNIVPGQCSFTVDHRVPPDFKPDDLEDRFRNTVADAPLGDNISVSVERTLKANPYLSNPDDKHIQVMRRNAEAVFEREVPLVGVRGFSDGRFFAEAGAQTLNFGPGDSKSNPHGKDENVAIEQVRKAGEAIAASLIDLSKE